MDTLKKKTQEKYQQSQQMLFEEAGIQPKSKFIDTNGPVKTIHYLELGKGDPLIFLHGGGSHASEWIPILKHLSDYFHCFVVDRPGCGLSDHINYRGLDYRQSAVDFTGSLMDALGLEKTRIIANSMGGYFSICFALDFPERVEKLLLIGAPAGMNHFIPPQLRILGIKGLNTFLLNTVGKPSPKTVRDIHKQLIVADINNVSDLYIEHGYHAQLIPGTMKSFATLLESVLTMRGFRKELYLGDQLDQLQIPVHFIWGDQDVFEKPETGRQKAAVIFDHSFEVIENAGHLPWLDQPDQCASLAVKKLL